MAKRDHSPHKCYFSSYKNTYFAGHSATALENLLTRSATSSCVSGMKVQRPVCNCVSVTASSMSTRDTSNINTYFAGRSATALENLLTRSATSSCVSGMKVQQPVCNCVSVTACSMYTRDTSNINTYFAGRSATALENLLTRSATSSCVSGMKVQQPVCNCVSVTACSMSTRDTSNINTYFAGRSVTALENLLTRSATSSCVSGMKVQQPVCNSVSVTACSMSTRDTSNINTYFAGRSVTALENLLTRSATSSCVSGMKVQQPVCNCVSVTASSMSTRDTSNINTYFAGRSATALENLLTRSATSSCVSGMKVQQPVCNCVSVTASSMSTLDTCNILPFCLAAFPGT